MLADAVAIIGTMVRPSITHRDNSADIFRSPLLQDLVFGYVAEWLLYHPCVDFPFLPLVRLIGRILIQNRFFFPVVALF